jgi:hypothetical protein
MIPLLGLVTSRAEFALGVVVPMPTWAWIIRLLSIIELRQTNFIIWFYFIDKEGGNN